MDIQQAVDNLHCQEEFHDGGDNEVHVRIIQWSVFDDYAVTDDHWWRRVGQFMGVPDIEDRGDP